MQNYIVEVGSEDGGRACYSHPQGCLASSAERKVHDLVRVGSNPTVGYCPQQSLSWRLCRAFGEAGSAENANGTVTIKLPMLCGLVCPARCVHRLQVPGRLEVQSDRPLSKGIARSTNNFFNRGPAEIHVYIYICICVNRMHHCRAEGGQRRLEEPDLQRLLAGS